MLLLKNQRKTSKSSFAANSTGLVFASFPIASQFYLFPSGQPQVADWILVVTFISVFLLTGGVRISRLPKIFKKLCYFVGYAALVQFCWAMFRQDVSYLKYIAFYCFNLSACYTYFCLYQKIGNRLHLFFLYSTTISLVMQPFFLSGNSIRAGGTFNNVNQLAYFSILAVSIFAVCLRSVKISRFTETLLALTTSVVSVFLVFKSASRAGVAVILLSVALVWSKSVRNIVIFVIIGTFIAPVAGGLVTEYAPAVLARMKGVNVGSASEGLAERTGLYRMRDNPHLLFLGAGEGEYSRFKRYHSLGIDFEIHSTIGSILFCYGVVGLFLATLPVIEIYKQRFSAVLFVTPPILFSMMHNGIRHTELWLLIVAAYSVAELSQSQGTQLLYLHRLSSNSKAFSSVQQ